MVEATSVRGVRSAISTLFSDRSSLTCLLKERMSQLNAWSSHSYPSQIVIILFTVTLALLLSQAPPILRFFKKMSRPSEQRSPFPFMSLPPELREMVYKNLLQDPHYPPKPACNRHSASLFDSFMPAYRQITSSTSAAPPIPKCCEKNKSNWIFLANKQIYSEYMDLLVKKTTFHLRVDSQNYPHPALPIPSPPITTSISPMPSSLQNPSSSSQHFANPTSTTPATTTSEPAQTPKTTSPTSLWTISPTTFSTLRRCSLKLITTSSMLGIHDPRTMPPGTWPLAKIIAHELRHVQSIRELNLHVLAVGDPLWNPLWVWYHATLSFIPMGSASSTSPSPTSPSSSSVSSAPPYSSAVSSATSPPSAPDAFASIISSGPKLNKISFSLDTWSPGENHLERNEAGDGWEWCCMAGHRIGADAPADMAVREFCARLYMECRICRPELKSDEEDLGGDDDEEEEEFESSSEEE